MATRYDNNEAGDSVSKFGQAQQALIRQVTISDETREQLADSFSEKSVRRGFMKKVYGILSVQLAVTVGVIALFIFHFGGGPGRDSYRFVNSNMWLLWTSFGVSLVVLFPMICIRSLRMMFPVNFMLLFVFTIAESIMLGMVSMLYTTESVIIAAGITAMVVFFLTIFAFQTKIDFTMCRGVMGCILFVFIIVGLIMLFIPQPRYYDTIYGGIGALIFSVYIVIDTQMMMGGNHKFSISPEEYIFAAVVLYLDILNLFLYILKIMGQKK